ncbi:aldo-keto reductase YhdN [Abditibacteriota bacterium]|nr:aldo-keto reductase YhdN [Abditibacteriota bacterium]
MNYNDFGKTGLSVSTLGFGAAPIGLLKTEQERVASILNLLLDLGVNLIDTAAAYAGSEEALGKAIGPRRDEYILVSKCGQKFDDLPGEAWSPEVITATIDRALRRLQTDHLDVMLLHSCGMEVLQKGEALKALVQAREAGKIRFAGYSGDNENVAYAATLPDVEVIETSINFVDQANIESLLPLTLKNGIGVIAKRPVANAAWKPLDDQPGLYKDYARTYHERFLAMGIRLEDLGLDEETTDWAQVALRFTLSQPGVHTAIIGTTNPDNARSNVDIANQGPLPEETLQKMRDAFLNAEGKSGETWKAQT